MLCRHRKSFDAKRTTYLMMKLTIDNRIAEKINMEGRRGDKLAFGRLEISKILIGEWKKNQILFYIQYAMYRLPIVNIFLLKLKLFNNSSFIVNKIV